MDKNMDYLMVLRALDEIPFGVGRKMLYDFLCGNTRNDSITRNSLQHKETFGSLAYGKDEFDHIVESLHLNDLIKTTSVPGNKFWKVMELTPKGVRELDDPQLFKRKVSFSFDAKQTTVSDEERQLFSAFGAYLEKYNDEQKKAIVCSNNQILCIAGAGSGKTTVLTKRIEFLVNFRSVDPRKILAITFTRKARQEMKERLAEMKLTQDVVVETFNSFCEKMLRTHGHKIYHAPTHVISWGDKIRLMKHATAKMNTSMEKALDIYYTYSQKRGKTDEQLANGFMNDCFFIRDYLKWKKKPLDASSFEIDPDHTLRMELVIGICQHIDNEMNNRGLRDFSDQLLDTIEIFEKYKELIPQFDHILVDEYQDVNSTQIHLLQLLNSPHLFCVGDPRQSIYGWRGSDIRYILQFEEHYPDCEVVHLVKNYRSTPAIVDLINSAVSSMKLPDLESGIEGEKDIHLLNFDADSQEREFIIQRILACDVSRGEIFVLARTNKQLNDLSAHMKLRGIKHVVRSDETKRTVIGGKDEVTLATIHAIKGLEADMVFVMGCTNFHFPCKAGEHPVIDMVKVEEYDKEEEERRLFYVALSRARKHLCMSYSGRKHTYYLDPNMLQLIDGAQVQLQSAVKEQKNFEGAVELVDRLKQWRRDLSKEYGIPSYMIMHDKTIIDIAQQQPLTQADLKSIHGLGPTKIQKYGEQLLDIVGGK